MRKGWLVLSFAALAACSDDDPIGPGTSGIDPATDTGLDPTASAPTTELPTEVTGDDPPVASCTSTANALRFACEATVGTASTAVWEISEDGAVVRTFTTPEDVAHAVTLWGLAPETAFEWTVTTDGGSATGQLTTGALPAGLADLDVAVSGTASAVDAVALPQVCGSTTYGLVIDTRGRVVWYQELEGGGGPGGGLTSYAWTDADTFVYVTGGTTAIELSASGDELWRATGFDRPLHHDVHRGGDLVYILNAALHGNEVVDGFYVLRDGVQVAEWDLADHVAVTGGDGVSDPFWQNDFPGSDDWSHANSIWSDGTTVYVSLRWQDAILKLDGDPDSASFGELEWILTGTSSTDLPTDFTWTDGGSFDGQHHVQPTATGITVFDNRAMNLDSRALMITLDEGAMTAAEGEVWSVGEHCDIQGGAFATDGGGMLATCATASRAAEFAAGSAREIWSLEPSCGAAAGPGAPTIAKMIPVALP
jgi:hypothetical protein